MVGQVRIDTRVYDASPERQPGQRALPRKYGEKYTPERTEPTLRLHCQEQTVRYRSRIVLARFLEGRRVRVVWCEPGLFTE